jgi:hypothetical protein
VVRAEELIRKAGQPSQFCAVACEEKSSMGRETPSREDLSLQAEELPLFRSRYQETSSDETAGSKRLSVCSTSAL